jgi:hypothetical protein
LYPNFSGFIIFGDLVSTFAHRSHDPIYFVPEQAPVVSLLGQRDNGSHKKRYNEVMPVLPPFSEPGTLGCLDNSVEV